MSKSGTGLTQILAGHESEVLSEWQRLLKESGALQTGRIKEAELDTQSRNFLGQFRAALLPDGTADKGSAAFQTLQSTLGDISRSRAIQGFTPTETATFVFSLKQPLFNAINKGADNAAAKAALIWQSSLLLDELGLYTIEVFQKTREEVIARQSREISELSTPVVKLWDGILALPLIGTLDSERTQTVMENLLQSIVEQTAEIAIIDITGVPTVDTLTAQHLLKTIAAARLMGADCIISGIRPQIAQTMVHLGVELNVVSKASLADAFALALTRLGRAVERIPILKLGAALLVTIQVDMHDRLAIALEEDLTAKIAATAAKGVLIDISALEIVDSFIGRMLDNIAAVSRVLDAETVVVGMRPAVAITLVELGLSLEGVKTALNVERGMQLIQKRFEADAVSRGDLDDSGHE
jgi:rsbT co-antagonist protein RsbR